MKTCWDCGVALVDSDPHETQRAIEYDLNGWDDGRVRLLLYQLNERRLWWSRDKDVVRIRAADRPTVDQLREQIEAGYDTWPEQPDAFILPDGRRVKELPLGPDVPRGEPAVVEWVADRSMSVRWFVAAARDFARRLRGESTK